jgi:hypothetical protein
MLQGMQAVQAVGQVLVCMTLQLVVSVQLLFLELHNFMVTQGVMQFRGGHLTLRVVVVQAVLVDLSPLSQAPQLHRARVVVLVFLQRLPVQQCCTLVVAVAQVVSTLVMQEVWVVVVLEVMARLGVA